MRIGLSWALSVLSWSGLLLSVACGDDSDLTDAGFDAGPARPDVGIDTGPSCETAEQCFMSPNVTYICQSRTCISLGCVSGYGDCDEFRSNGCEAELMISNEHCGRCNNPCTMCDEGTCSDPEADAGS